MVTCGLSRFTRVFPCNKKITGEQSVKMLVEQWFEPHGAPKHVHSDEDVRIRSDTGWYKRVLNALNVEVTTGVPYTHTSNPLCERQSRVVGQNLRILMNQERTKDWVSLVSWAVLTMNSQRTSSTGFTPHELFHGGRPAWFFKTSFPADFKSPVGDWLEYKQSMTNQAGTNLRHIRDRELSRWNRLRRPASFKVGDLVLVHHSRLPSWPRNCLQDPFFGPYRIIRIDGSRIHVRCSPGLVGELLCAPKQLRHYHSPDKLSWDEWRLGDSEVERIDLENATSPEDADKLEEMTADDMVVDGYYVVAGGASSRGGERHHGVGKADQSTESDRTGRGAAHHAGPRGTPERHGAGHNQGTRTGAKQRRPPGATNPESAHNTQRTTAHEQVPSNSQPTHHKPQPTRNGNSSEGEGGNPSPGGGQAKQKDKAAKGKGEAHHNAPGRPARPTRPSKTRTPPPPADPSQEWRGPPTTSGSETQPGVAGSSTQEPPPGVARDPNNTPHTTAAKGPQPGVAGTAHHQRQRNPARSGGE